MQELKSIIIKEYRDNYMDSTLSLDILNYSNTQIFFYSQLLLGSKESTDNPLYFGSVDSKGEFIESSPIYYLETDSDEFDIESNSTNSNNNPNNTNSNHTNTQIHTGTQALQVFLNNSTLTILNYSLLDSSLNIKLECKITESKEILEQEKALRNRQESKDKDSTNDEIISTAMLHPVLEDNEIKCPHGGVVKLKSNKGRSFKSKNVPMILESDLLNSQIIGCTYHYANI